MPGFAGSQVSLFALEGDANFSRVDQPGQFDGFSQAGHQVGAGLQSPE